MPRARASFKKKHAKKKVHLNRAAMLRYIHRRNHGKYAETKGINKDIVENPKIAAMIEAIKNELEMIEVLKKECDNKFAELEKRMNLIEEKQKEIETNEMEEIKVNEETTVTETVIRIDPKRNGKKKENLCPETTVTETLIRRLFDPKKGEKKKNLCPVCKQNRAPFSTGKGFLNHWKTKHAGAELVLPIKHL